MIRFNTKNIIYAIFVNSIDKYIKKDNRMKFKKKIQVLPKNLKIIDEYRCKYAKEILIITPHEKSYNWLSIYECRYNEKNNE